MDLKKLILLLLTFVVVLPMIYSAETQIPKATMVGYIVTILPDSNYPNNKAHPEYISDSSVLIAGREGWEQSGGTGQSQKYIYVDFGAGNEKLISKVEVYVFNNVSIGGLWYLKYSPDNTTWTNATEKYSSGYAQVYNNMSFTVPTTYRFYGLMFAPNAGYYDQTLTEMGWYSNPPPPDIIPPSFSNAVDASINFNQYSNFTANITITDNVAVNRFIFSTNATGSWVNKTSNNGLSNPYVASQSANLTVVSGSKVCWYYWANDTLGNSNKSSEFCFNVVPPPTPPTISFPKCVSCYENNKTYYTNPIIRVNCTSTEGGSCAGVRMSNNSVLSYDSVTNVGNCTPDYGIRQWLCQYSGSLTIGLNHTLYFWAINTTSAKNHTLYNLSTRVEIFTSPGWETMIQKFKMQSYPQWTTVTTGYREDITANLSDGFTIIGQRQGTSTSPIGVEPQGSYPTGIKFNNTKIITGFRVFYWDYITGVDSFINLQASNDNITYINITQLTFPTTNNSWVNDTFVNTKEYFYYRWNPTVGGAADLTIVEWEWFTDAPDDVVISSPSGINDNPVNFNVTANSPAGRDLTFYRFINDSYNGTGNATLTLADGEYRVAYIVSDGIYNVTYNSTWFMVDSVDPSISTNTYPHFLFFADNKWLTNFYNLTGSWEIADEHLFQYNLRIDGVLISNQTDMTVDYYNVTLNLNVSNYSVGNHFGNLTAWDGHTKAAIENITNSQSLFKNKIKFEPSKNDFVSVEVIGASMGSELSTEKEKDRYTLSLKNNKKDKVTFRYTSDKNMVIPSRQAPQYPGWIIIPELEIWIDSATGEGNVSKVSRIDEKTIEVEVNNIKGDLKLHSIGILNRNTIFFNFSVINLTLEYESLGFEGQLQDSTLNISLNGVILNMSASFAYEQTSKATTKTDSANSSFIIALYNVPLITNFSEIHFMYWNISLISGNYTVITLNQTVYKNTIFNCTNSTWFNMLSFWGKDEESDSNVTFNLNIDLWVTPGNGTTLGNYTSLLNFKFNGMNKYDLCVYPNVTSTLNAVMEYSSLPTWVDRKYYLNDYVVKEGVHDIVYLYLLNSSKSSEILLNVFDRNTGDNVEGAFIKILRYYPGSNFSYNLVEIEKTDNLGQTMAKMVLSDVFYKYIVEYPAGYVRLDTDAQKVLSLTKRFPISLAGNPLEDLNGLSDISGRTTCTKDTDTCRFTWSDTSNVARQGTIEVYRTTRFSNEMIYTASMSSAATTLPYTITEATAGNSYLIKSYIVVGDTQFLTGTDTLSYVVNKISDTPQDKQAMLFPYFLLLIGVAFAFIDFGAIGVLVGLIVGLIIGAACKLLPIDIGYVVSLILLIIILIFKIGNKR